MGLLKSLGLRPLPANKAPSGGPGVDPPAALRERQRKLQPRVDALIASGDPVGANVKKANERIGAAMAAGRWNEADTLLKSLEGLAAKPLASPAGDSAAPPAAGAAAAAGGAAKPAPAAGGSQDEFDKAKAAIQAEVDAAEKVRTDHPDALSPAIEKKYADARKAVEDLVAVPNWAAAKAALPAWKSAAQSVNKAWGDQKIFQASRAKNEVAIARAEKALSDKLPLPPGPREPCLAALTSLKKSVNERNWAQATGKLPGVNAAVAALLKAMDDGAKFYTAFDAMKADFDAANKMIADVWKKLATMGRFKLAVVNYRRTVAGMRAAVNAQKWKEAVTAAADVHAQALALVKQKGELDAASAPFQAEFAKLKNYAQADKIADAPPPQLRDAQARVFRQEFTAMVDARDAGDFGTAIARLTPLQAAIDALIKANADLEAQRQAFEAAMAGVPDYNAALVLAGKPPAALAKPAADFDAADKLLAKAKFEQDWVAAKAAVPALKTAVEALIQAKGAANSGATAQDVTALQSRLDALKPRTDKASDGPVTSFVDGHQKAVRDSVAAVTTALAAKNVVDAEVGLTALAAELDTMEKAKKEQAEHLAKFAAARDGDVKKALDLRLEPATLADTRTKALNKLSQSIEDLADQGMIAQANQKTAEWAAQARSWMASKAAFDNLHGAKPDAKKLAELTAKPGGGEVLDALVAELPDDPPQNVMTAALKARYGFGVKRFEKANKDPANTDGLTPQKPTTPDKPLKRVYETLGKIPAKGVKGKVSELVEYDSDDGGAMFSPGDKKVYMYCGRPDDPKADKQQFNVPGSVVPEGEEVEESCKPADATPAPFFDFALLHEVGHGEDEAKKFIENRLGNATFGGWRSHTIAEVAKKAAEHFEYDVAYVSATLSAKGSKPPKVAPKPPKGVSPEEWNKRHDAALAWCQSVREDNALWDSAALSKQMAIDGRVYHEAYASDATWVSYPFSARAQGITSYQFRSHWEWFAELYAAYFSKRLKPNHPATAWLKDFSPPPP